MLDKNLSMTVDPNLNYPPSAPTPSGPVIPPPQALPTMPSQPQQQPTPIMESQVTYSGSTDLLVPSLGIVPHMVTIKSLRNQRYLCGDLSKFILKSWVSPACDRSRAKEWESFMAIPLGGCTYAFRCYHGPYLSVDASGLLHFKSHSIDKEEIFTVERHSVGFAIRDFKGRYVFVRSSSDMQHVKNVMAAADPSVNAASHHGHGMGVSSHHTTASAASTTATAASYRATTTTSAAASNLTAQVARRNLDHPDQYLFAKRMSSPTDVKDAVPYHDRQMALNAFFSITPMERTGPPSTLGTGDRKVVLLTCEGTTVSLTAKGQLTHAARGANAASYSQNELFTLMHMGPNRYVLQAGNGKYLCSEKNGNLVSNRKIVDEWERFGIVTDHNNCNANVQQGIESWTIALRTKHDKYWCADGNGTVHAKSKSVQEREKFLLQFIPELDMLPVLGQGTINASLRLQANHKYLCAEASTLFNMGKGGTLSVSRNVAKDWERFRLMHCGKNLYALKTHHGKYVSGESNGGVSAHSHSIGDCERWLVEWYTDGIAFRSYFGRYLGVVMNDNYNGGRNNQPIVANHSQVAGPNEKFFIHPL